MDAECQFGLDAKAKAILTVLEGRERFIRVIVSLDTGLIALLPAFMNHQEAWDIAFSGCTGIIFWSGVGLLLCSILLSLVWLLKAQILVKKAYGQWDLILRQPIRRTEDVIKLEKRIKRTEKLMMMAYPTALVLFFLGGVLLMFVVFFSIYMSGDVNEPMRWKIGP